MSEEKIYPTTPDADGFYYADSEDETLDIKTKQYDNGSKIKLALLPKSGKTAVVRTLKGKETKDILRYMGKDPEQYTIAAITVATTLNGEKQPIEVIGELDMKDYYRLLGMYQDLNF